MIELPGVVKRTDLVGVERDGIALLVPVIGGVRSHLGSETGDEHRYDKNYRGSVLLLHACFLISKKRERTKEKES
jgi:hypothetical protein